MRWALTIVALAGLGGAAFGQERPPKSTAVNVLENAQGWFAAGEDEDASAPLKRWFGRARLDELPDPPVCTEQDPACPSMDDVYRDPPAWLTDGLPANLAVLRDMHGWLYLAGCPAVALSREELFELGSDDGREPVEIDPLAVPVLRGCLDVEKGRSFSMARYGGSARLVVRGLEVPMELIAVRRIKPTGPGASYQPEVSQTSGALDTTPRVSVAGGVFDTTPRWEQPAPGVRGTPSNVSLSGPELPKDGVPTGRVRVRCDEAELGVSFDGAYLGECPASTPMPAGRHFLQWRSGGRQYEHMFRLAPGKTVELHVQSSNECLVVGGVE